jgi:CDGSH-type Zn-finger protein
MANDYGLKFPRQIEVSNNGPYLVTGGIPLVRKIQVVSEMGEPLTWQKQGEIKAGEAYCLCRCGMSRDKPFCDGTHVTAGFDGSEQAPISISVERQVKFPSNSQLEISFDLDLCTESGFCGNRNFSLLNATVDTSDIEKRTLAIHMVEHCPSGALTYRFVGESHDTEVDLPEEIAVTTEITSEGAIEGPLWVTGGIRVIRADRKPFEVRNRVTLCSCGHSQSMPLCDGSHRSPENQRHVAKE